MVSHGATLWTRDRARPIREQLEHELDALNPGETLVLDLKGVEAFDFSFANELFGKLLLTLPRHYPQRFVIVEGLTTYTRENLNSALASLELAMIERAKKNLVLIGKVHPADVATFAAVAKSKAAVTATTLANALSLNITAVNERLNKLTALGLLRRETGQSAAGREQYLYSTPT